MSKWYYISMFALLNMLVVGKTCNAQIVQDFNQSVNQIGDCWQSYNMEITTKNTINRANQKKALIGRSPSGSPAYSFTSPMLQLNGTGSIDFRHKLNANNGTHRQLEVYLLDQSENVVQTLHAYVYIAGGVPQNGNPTTVVNVSFPITVSGTFMIRWEFTGAGGSSLAMVDDIEIDGTDVSDATNDNGYGYCRPDDYVYDTICAGSTVLHKVPHAIPQSDWSWTFLNGANPGVIDSTVVATDKDTMVNVDWNYTASGDYILEATEIRPPYNTTTYSVEFNIHVMPAPAVSMGIDSVCPGAQNEIGFEFTGNGDWTVQFTDGTSTYNQTYSSSTGTFLLPSYSSTTNVQVLSLTDNNGCTADTSQLPNADAVVFNIDPLGPIYHY